jgi:hypothetical protein
MSRETGGAKNRGQRKKRLAVKRVAIKDLQPRKEIKAGVEPINWDRLRKK